MRRNRPLVTAVAVGALLVSGAVPASAAMIAYRDAAGDTWLADPDGPRRVQLTSDAAPAGGQHVIPAMDDAGNVLVGRTGLDRSFRIVDPTGTTVAGPTLIDLPLCSIFPFASALTADGSTVAFSYFRGQSLCSSLAQLTTGVFFARLPTADGVLPSVSGLSHPVWVPRRPDPTLIGVLNDQIAGQVLPGVGPVPPLGVVVPNPNPGAIDFASVDVSRVADLVMVEVALDGTGARQRDVFLYRSPGVPGVVPQPLCSFALDGAVSEGPVRPRFSPDGARISWTATDGVRVAGAPAVPAGQPEALATTCQVGAPSLLIPGGRDAAWSPASLPPVVVSPPPVDPGSPPPSGGDPAPAVPSAPAPSPLRATAKPKAPLVVVTRPRGRVALRVTLTLPRTLAGRSVDLQVARGRTWVRVARIVRVPAGGRVVRRIVLAPRLVAGAGRVRVRAVVRATVRARAAVGAVRTTPIPRVR